jgi:carbamoyl-phosphate synthase large subunit
MNPLNILITGSGAPGTKGTIYSLKHNFDGREIVTIGTDINDEVIGKYLCDRYYVIPRASTGKEYLDALLRICAKEKIDVIIPQNTAELSLLASNKYRFEEIGTAVVCSGQDSINAANNKYELMRICKNMNIPTGKFSLVSNFNNLIDFAKELGWPDKNIVVKPPVSNGLRGLRIVDENRDLKKSFYEEKPTSLYTKMEDLERILGDTFPDLIVTDYLPGPEYTVDVLRTEKDITVIPRKRESILLGITFGGTTEHNEEIIEYSKRISEEINLEYCFGFQFKLDENDVPKILESNPRVQGTMVLATFAGANVIYGAVKSILGEEVPRFNIKWGTKMLRYWGGLHILNNKLVSSL